MKLETIFPFLVWFKLLTKESVKADFIAGLTGAVIVLPQGVAFATIAGLPPEYGLYTAMVTPIIAAFYKFSAKSGFIKHVGNNQFFDSKPEAIASMYEQLDKNICSNCNALIFKECP